MMGEFMVCVDRIMASAACFNSGNALGSGGGGASPAHADCVAAVCPERKEEGARSKKEKKGGEVVECRICQEEEEERSMETPCACNGTLRFAHRKCIQKWCNKKGNIICEICNQVFAPNYSVPPNRVVPDVLAIDVRQSWGAQMNVHDSHFLAIASVEQELLNAEYEDYAAASSSGIACCRTVAIILMLLLLVRHILIATREIGIAQDISALFNVSLQFAGLFLPCYVITRSCYLMLCRRRRQIL